MTDTTACSSRFHGYVCDLEPHEHEREDWHEASFSSGSCLEWDDAHADRILASSTKGTNA